jgi:type IV secretion system protein VirB6
MRIKNVLISVLFIFICSLPMYVLLAGRATASDAGSTGGSTTPAGQDGEIINNTVDTVQGAVQKYPWMDATFDTISNFLSFCIEIPQFPGMEQSSTTVNLQQNPQWVSTGVQVEKDKTLQIEWLGNGIQTKPRKYKVMYRIDPRFSVPQVFIQKYNYDTGSYTSDFHEYKNGLLLDYQQTAEMDFANRIKDFDDYFRFVGRPKILLNNKDVVNITLDYSRNFFANAQMNNELGSLNHLSVIYTESPLPDNKMIYSSATTFCTYGITEATAAYSTYCVDNVYQDSSGNYNSWMGKITNSAFEANKANINKCPDGANGRNNIPLCYYDKGRGMSITVNNNSVKDMQDAFKTSPFTGVDFFYYKSDFGGELDFTTFWDIDQMYNGYPQFMADWPSDGDYFAFLSAVNAASANISLNYLYFGRYLMDVEIGNSVYAVSNEDLANVQVEYIISSDSMPSDSDAGTTIDMQYRGNAYESGYVYVRATRLDDNLSGSINVKFANYTGSSFISDLIYGVVLKPLRDQFNSFTRLIYTGFTNDDALINALRLMIILYISIYALMFLAGAVEITVTDLVMRVLKIGLVSVLFTQNSWDFFNTYVFRLFTDGIDYLMTSVSGVTSSVGNPFGFIDPIFDRYTDPTIFALLFIQLLQIQLGLVFFAIIAIYAMFLYLKAIVQVIVAYCVAFVGLAVMISLAPIFIAFMLFERTRSIFDNWLSLMFNYLIEPTILLVFFLLIDQIMAEQLLKTVARSCWGTLIPLAIYLDLNKVGIPLDFSFSLPFLPGIPFYVPDILDSPTVEDMFSKNGTIAQIASSTFLLFAISKLAGGMTSFVNTLAQQLTNVYVEAAPGQKSSQTMAESILGDLGKIGSAARAPFAGAANWAKGFANDKLLGQKISSRRVDSTFAEKESAIDYKLFNGIKEGDSIKGDIKANPNRGLVRSQSVSDISALKRDALGEQTTQSNIPFSQKLRRSNSVPDLNKLQTNSDVASSKLTKEQLALDRNTISKIAKMQGEQVPAENRGRYRKKLLGSESQEVQARNQNIDPKQKLANEQPPVRALKKQAKDDISLERNVTQSQGGAPKARITRSSSNEDLNTLRQQNPGSRNFDANTQLNPLERPSKVNARPIPNKLKKAVEQSIQREQGGETSTVDRKVTVPTKNQADTLQERVATQVGKTNASSLGDSINNAQALKSSAPPSSQAVARDANLATTVQTRQGIKSRMDAKQNELRKLAPLPQDTTNARLKAEKVEQQSTTVKRNDGEPITIGPLKSTTEELANSQPSVVSRSEASRDNNSSNNQKNIGGTSQETAQRAALDGTANLKQEQQKGDNTEARLEKRKELKLEQQEDKGVEIRKESGQNKVQDNTHLAEEKVVARSKPDVKQDKTQAVPEAERADQLPSKEAAVEKANKSKADKSQDDIERSVREDQELNKKEATSNKVARKDKNLKEQPTEQTPETSLDKRNQSAQKESEEAARISKKGDDKPAEPNTKENSTAEPNAKENSTSEPNTKEKPPTDEVARKESDSLNAQKEQPADPQRDEVPKEQKAESQPQPAQKEPEATAKISQKEEKSNPEELNSGEKPSTSNNLEGQEPNSSNKQMEKGEKPSLEEKEAKDKGEAKSEKNVGERSEAKSNKPDKAESNTSNKALEMYERSRKQYEKEQSQKREAALNKINEIKPKKRT